MPGLEHYRQTIEEYCGKRVPGLKGIDKKPKKKEQPAEPEARTLKIELPNSDAEIVAAYNALPDCVKELFFGKGVSESEDLPLFLARQFLATMSDEAWKSFKELSAEDRRKHYNLFASVIVKAFLQDARDKYALQLGESKLPGFLRPADAIRLTEKERQFVQFCKPLKWISKRR
ncbi:MAG: hypothetical protein HUK26_08205 [Duodenibacillus sp.]|nr:hypothetical protein [Duodenibacillus sp.]